MSQAELDAAEALLKQQQANADAIRATIEKKTIRAPFAGQLGIRLVNLGEYLDVGKPIVSLQSLSPVYADFSLPQQELARLQPGLTVRVTSDTYPGKQFTGELTAINPDLDRPRAACGCRRRSRTPSNCCAPACLCAWRWCCRRRKAVLVDSRHRHFERAVWRFGLRH